LSLPIRPRPEFTYQIMPSGAMSKRRTVVPASGSLTSVTSRVSGWTFSRAREECRGFLFSDAGVRFAP
jgi:hypothetical protein